MLVNVKKQLVLLEKITDVKVRGNEGDEKVFVTVERKIATCYGSLIEAKRQRVEADSIGKEGHSGPGDVCLVLERRDLCFLPQPDPQAAGRLFIRRQIHPPQKPDFSHTLRPTP